jgi:exonuclease VII small subunit
MHSFFSHVLKTAQRCPLPVWCALIIALPFGVGLFGVWLLGSWEYAECQTVGKTSWAAESTRLYCAQLMVDPQTGENLGEAIELANSITPDHPLRKDSDRLIQQWAHRLMELGEAKFQDGNLNDAIKLVQQIPDEALLHEIVSNRINYWQKTWEKAEKIIQDAQTAIEDDKFSVALAEARKLLRVPNQYWSMVRFQELVNQVQVAKESWKKEQSASRDRPSPNDKPSFDGKDTTITTDLMSNWQKEQEREAAVHLEKARRSAATGDLGGLRDAIGEAQLIFSDTPHYKEARQLIADWNRQIEVAEDRPYLSKAITLADRGDIKSLEAAISEANNIYFGRALYREAQSRIDQWSTQVRQLYEQQNSQDLPANTGSPAQETDYRIPPAPTNP